MNKSVNVSILFLIVLGVNISAQELTHQVLVPVAGIATTSSLSYTQTIGETAVEIINSPDYVFTQGFQQPGIKVSRETPPQGNGVKVYPNPVTDFVTIELFGYGTRGFRIEFFNISGTIIKVENLALRDQYWHIQQYSVENYSRGLFFIRIVSSDGLISRTFKVEKI
jgi:hypothetical protein